MEEEMSRLLALDPELATGRTKQLFDAVHAQLGLVPNMVRVIANSPAALKGYLAFGGALASGALDEQLQEQIALAVAEANGCGYCLSAHAAIGKAAGLSDADVAAARRGTAADLKHAAALQFAAALVEGRGRVTGTDLARVRTAGYTDEQIVEIIAAVALNVFTNYLNITAHTDLEFPPVEPLEAAA
jgi:uncharacterized peroxidase-related enzyme